MKHSKRFHQMILSLFFSFLQIVEAINAKKFIIGEWQIYNKIKEISLYTIEFHKNVNTNNMTNNSNSTIIGSIWINRKEDVKNDDDNTKYNPDNFIMRAFELIFTTENKGKVNFLYGNNEKDNLFIKSSYFSISETETKNIIISFDSNSIKLTCNFTNSTHGIIMYKNLNNINEGENELFIAKKPKLTYFRWSKLFEYLFYVVFIIFLVRSILITRSLLLQKSRAFNNTEPRKDDKIKEKTQQNIENDQKLKDNQPPKDNMKVHPKSE